MKEGEDKQSQDKTGSVVADEQQQQQPLGPASMRDLLDKVKRERRGLDNRQARQREAEGPARTDGSVHSRLEQLGQDSKKANDDELLYKRLEKKWGLSSTEQLEKPSQEDISTAFLNDILTTGVSPAPLSNKTTTFASAPPSNDSLGLGVSPLEASRSRVLQEPSQQQQIQQSSQVPSSRDSSSEQFLAQHMYRPQRRNITEYAARYSHEIDPMMQGSHLDLKNEEAPKMMRYMDEFREFRPQINIGERWGAILQESTVSRIQYEQQISKGGNLISYMAKTGKLGIDLYFILFGVTAAFILPYYFYQHQKQKVNYIQKVRKINPETVPDFYYSEYDLDEISVQKSFYNQFTNEIVEEKTKKLKLHKEIQSLTNMLFANK